MKKKIPTHILILHVIFWPIITISILMNVWLFASFFSKPIYQLAGGIIGAAVDTFKLYNLNRLDIHLRLWQSARTRVTKKLLYTFPMKSLVWYTFFLLVSAGASLLFGLIDIDRSIKQQSIVTAAEGGSTINVVSLRREISALKASHDSLLNTKNLERMADRVTANTNRFLLSSGLLRIEEEKTRRRKEARAIEQKLAAKENTLATYEASTKNTSGAFDYLADFFIFAFGSSTDTRTAKIIFLVIIIIAIEGITGECRGAMRGLTTTHIKAPTPTAKKEKKTSPGRVKVYSTKRRK
jgi:hypothetical protein